MARNKKQLAPSKDPMEHYMKVVSVDTCILCKQQCAKGLAYIEKMQHPGAIGNGVPCILTKGKPGLDQKGRRR